MRFAVSDVYVINLTKDDRWMLLGPPEDKNYIAVFTDDAILEAAVRDRGDVVAPIAINGRDLLEKARDSRRGLIINPTDDNASVWLPANMMGPAVEAL